MRVLDSLLRILALTRKELLAVLKDRRSRLSLLIPPVVQALIFGYAATYDLNHVTYAVLDQDHSAASRQLLAGLDGSGVFERVADLRRASDVATYVDARRALLVVQINPLERQEVPTSSKDIMNRVNEITFNSSLSSEFRAIDFVDRLIDQGKLTRGTGAGQYRRINAHRIVLDRMGKNLDSDTKLSTDYDFFEMLRTSGKRAARRFLDAHFDDIGVRSTFDLRAEAQAEWA